MNKQPINSEESPLLALEKRIDGHDNLLLGIIGLLRSIECGAVAVDPSLVRLQIRETYDALVSRVEKMNDFWRAHANDAIVYQLPIIRGDGGDAPEVPAQIEPNVIVGEQAVRMAAQSLGQFQRDPEQHPGTVWRLPGVVFLNEPIGEIIDSINQVKDALHLLIKLFPEGSRATITRPMMPGVSMLQVYRHIHFSDRVPHRLSFTWAGHTTLTKTMRPDQAIAFLNERKSIVPADYDCEKWESIIEFQKKQINQPPMNAEIKLRRYLAPHPRLMLFYDGNTAYDKMYHANLPIFVYAPNGTKSFKVSHLTQYERAKRRGPRKGYRHVDLIEKLNMYWVYTNETSAE